MKKIIVLDDDPDILQLVELVLTIDNYQVKAITRWEEIDDLTNGFGPDLILLDISLNGADGRDICKKRKQSGAWNYIPVILFSANSEQGHDFQNCGALAFIPKPFELNELLHTVKSHLS